MSFAARGEGLSGTLRSAGARTRRCARPTWRIGRERSRLSEEAGWEGGKAPSANAGRCERECRSARVRDALRCDRLGGSAENVPRSRSRGEGGKASAEAGRELENHPIFSLSRIILDNRLRAALRGEPRPESEIHGNLGKSWPRPGRVTYGPSPRARLRLVQRETGLR